MHMFMLPLSDSDKKKVGGGGYMFRAADSRAAHDSGDQKEE